MKLSTIHYPLSTILFLLLALSGCRKEPPAQPAPPPQRAPERAELLLYCGAGLRPPAAELAEVFGQDNGVHVALDAAGSEILLSRIRVSRRGDLYMPGESYYVDQAQAQGLVLSRATACYFVPVILVQKGNPQRIVELEDLLRPGLKLGLGNPEATAVGLQARRIMDKNHIAWEDLQKNVVFQSLTVNELGTQVQIGSIDAAIVWDAMAGFYANATQAVPIPPHRNAVSTVEVSVLSTTTHCDLAEKFQAFVVSPRGREIFRKHKYTVDPPQPATAPTTAPASSPATRPTTQPTGTSTAETSGIAHPHLVLRSEAALVLRSGAAPPLRGVVPPPRGVGLCAGGGSDRRARNAVIGLLPTPGPVPGVLRHVFLAWGILR